jgi:hypothetical protein
MINPDVLHQLSGAPPFRGWRLLLNSTPDHGRLLCLLDVSIWAAHDLHSILVGMMNVSFPKCTLVPKAVQRRVCF